MTVSPPVAPAAREIRAKLEELYHKNVQHLHMPLARQSTGVTNMKGFLFFMGLLLAIGLSFGAGFLTAYTFFPVNTPLLPLSSGVREERLTGKPASVVPLPSAYGARGAMLQSGKHNSLLAHAEGQAQYQATQAARSSISQTLQNWSNMIRQTFGNFFGSAVIPFTTGLAQSAVDVLLPAYPSGAAKETPKVPAYREAGASPNPTLEENPSSPSRVKASQKEDHRESDSAPESSAEKAGKFSLQLQEFSSSKEAWAIASRLAEKGLGSYVVRLERAEALTFAVRIGQFKTYNEAREASAMLRHQFQLAPRVVTIYPFEERLK